MRPSKDDMSGQKALQGAKTETKELLGGTNVNNNLPLVIDLPIKQINDFITKSKQKTILVIVQTWFLDRFSWRKLDLASTNCSVCIFCHCFLLTTTSYGL